MSDFIAEYYLWIMAFHIIAVISWLAGMLYLPRLFVYHCQVEPKSEASEKFKIMERKLLRAIINPAMIVAFILGIMLAYQAEIYKQGWFHVKLALLFALTGIHGILAKHRKEFERNENKKSERYYRILNEIPAVLMILIVILAVVKPF